MSFFVKYTYSGLPVLGLLVLTGFLAGCDQGAPGKVAAEVDPRPNFLILVADDLGYTDIGAYGSEIRTPNLDELAKNSVRFTNFHVLPMCAPTRSVLLSGVDNHIAGLGSMFDSSMLEGVSGQAGYERYLHERVATLPELLGDSGYHTLMAGKWHLGASKGLWPIDRGFEQSFALLGGAGDHFSFLEGGYAENDVIAEFDAKDFYSTRTYTDKLIEFVNKNHSDGRPFFAYAAYTAPHWPLQVPDDYIDRYKGDYDEGFDALRGQRIERARDVGSIPDLDYSKSIEATGPAWEDLNLADKQHYARRMEIYSAMVENLDHHIGRLVDHLESIGALENTVILFMSDNGAESDEMERNPVFAERVRRGNYNNDLKNLGTSSSYMSYGAGWAQASSGPFLRFKNFVTEGGTRAPAFLYFAGQESTTGRWDGQYLSVMDIAPTILQLASVELPGSSYRGREVSPMEGKSFAGVVGGDQDPIHGTDESFGIELHGARSLRRGNYKLVWEQPPVNSWWGYAIPESWYRWQLYDIANDPAEHDDISMQHPELAEELASLWEDYADAHGVVRGVRISNFERWQQPPAESIQ